MPAGLLDTNAVSNLMRNHPNVRARVAAHPDPVATCAIVVGEIRHGLERLPPGKKRSDLETHANTVLAGLPIEPITELIAETYGRLKASLELHGLNLDDNDLWIAATAISQGNVLVSRDKIFSRVPGLQVEDWSA